MPPCPLAATTRVKGATVLAVCLSFTLGTKSLASAGEFSFKIEPAVAVPLASPQSDIYDTGGAQSVKALFGITPYLDVGPTGTFVFLPPSVANSETGVVWGIGPGLRLKRPHSGQSWKGLSPWLDADILYVRTGELNRVGFDAAIGLSLPIGESRTFWLGPFVRYLQVFQPGRAGFDTGDANILSFGISLEVGSGSQRATAVEVRTVTQEVIKVVTKEVPVASCPDGDGDGVPDSVDRCPEVAGTADDWGCRHYNKVVIQRDKLELKEKLYFAWDQARLEEASFPILDEVVTALKDNPGFQVQIQGHTDSSGIDEHNQSLSQNRAAAVLDYLAAHGIAKERLVSKGFSSSVPMDSNATSAGREKNRRVEFLVHFVSSNPGSAK